MKNWDLDLPPGRKRIDLNADLGEGCANDRALLELVTSACVCCGAHAGTDESIRQTLADARRLGVAVGAHPGYPDRASFGRRDQHLARSEIVTLICDQVAYLKGLAQSESLEIAFLKPHGALYNQAQRDETIADAVIAAAERLGLALLGLPGSLLEIRARDRRLRYLAEGFPRTEPDAVLHEPAEIDAQVVRLVNEGLVATLCIHGDDPRAVANAERVRRVLTRHEIAIRSFGNERR
jgi:UPF0271 protein